MARHEHLPVWHAALKLSVAFEDALVPRASIARACRPRRAIHLSLDRLPMQPFAREVP